MLTGKIKWVKEKYGFIIPDDGGGDVFLHASILRAAGHESLDPGTPVEYTSKSAKNGKGHECVTLRVLA